MSEASEKLRVTVSLGGNTFDFQGSPESVMHSVNDFVLKQIPSLDLAKRISVNYSAAELMETFANHVKITPEGPRVWKGERKLTDREVISLQLLSAKIANTIGKRQEEAMAINEIQTATGINPKSISSRLSEIIKLGHVEKINSDQGTSFRLTTQGIYWLERALAKK